MPRCADCGKFCHPVAWQMVYSGALPEPDHEEYKCQRCLDLNGPFTPQHGIVPEYSCGLLSPPLNQRAGG